MKQNKSMSIEDNEDKYFIVPNNWLQTISEKQQQILSLLENKVASEHNGIGGYISESEAKKLLGRKTTWFWNMRSSGRLAFSKVGGKTFYMKQDIINLLEKHHSSIANQF
jgi:hypothetical protein